MVRNLSRAEKDTERGQRSPANFTLPRADASFVNVFYFLTEPYFLTDDRGNITAVHVRMSLLR